MELQPVTAAALDEFSASPQEFQSAMLNILEDFAEEKMRSLQVQTATLNVLEDFAAEKERFREVQTATLNILEDFDAERSRLQQSQRAFLNILEDIDLEKEKVASAYQRIEAVNVELQQFAYAASHDLKAPLRVIDNASRWLEEDLQEHLTEETRENMNLLRGRVGRMERLLDDLLEYSRIGRITDDRFAEVIPGDALMSNILELLSPPEGFTVTVGDRFADVLLRRMPLQQILMNLVSNAIKHHDKKAGHIDVTVEDSGKSLTFAVKDDGPGIPARFHDQIFQMFQTLKPRDQVEGSGMGLAMVRKNIAVFGGKLDLASAEGQGSTFSFSWPKDQDHAIGNIRTDDTPSNKPPRLIALESGGRLMLETPPIEDPLAQLAVIELAAKRVKQSLLDPLRPTTSEHIALAREHLRAVDKMLGDAVAQSGTKS